MATRKRRKKDEPVDEPIAEEVAEEPVPEPEPPKKTAKKGDKVGELVLSRYGGITINGDRLIAIADGTRSVMECIPDRVKVIIEAC
jgi:hypothetical protein